MSRRILTPVEVFAKLRDEGFLVHYARLPVTDEQSPIPNTYNLIEERVTSALTQHGSFDNMSWVFNCQMGRGRTTTGMIAAALVANILLSPQSVAELTSAPANSASGAGELTWESHAWDGREAEPYLAGEYKMTLQLVGVMQYGRAAKQLADVAIDRCDAVQNLRRAVYDFKLRAEAAPPGSAKAHKIFEVALNYLYRLCTLYVFANFLLEKKRAVEQGVPGAAGWDFKGWMERRREITHVLGRRTLE